MSRIARAAQVLGIAAPALTLVGIGLTQVGMPALIGFATFAFSILIGLIALVLGLIGLFLTRGDGGGRRQALVGIAMGCLMIVLVLVGRAPGTDAPAINDITTNLEDPPAFAAQGDRDMAFPPPMFAATYSVTEYKDLIRNAYPDLEPIRRAASVDASYAAALARAQDMGWTVTVEDPATASFQAQDVTAVFRFVDDISVRVRADGTGSVIDVRSKSRDGRGDIGANAARIRAFRDGLE